MRAYEEVRTAVLLIRAPLDLKCFSCHFVSSDCAFDSENKKQTLSVNSELTSLDKNK